MNHAYQIKYLGPTNMAGARLAMQFPGSAKRRFIPRDFAVSADRQAQDLAEATPGFIAFASYDADTWVYITQTTKGNLS